MRLSFGLWTSLVLSTLMSGSALARHPSSYQEAITPPKAGVVAWDKLELKDENGKALKLGDFKGKLLVLDFFFTSCPSICPPQTAGMLATLKKLDQPTRERIQFVSISVDTKNDSQDKLKAYRERFKVPAELPWRFVNGVVPSSIEGLTEHFGSVSGKDPLEHKARVYLVGPQGQYLVSYPTQPFDSERLARELSNAVQALVQKP